MNEAIGRAMILLCVFCCGAASMVLAEKFQKVPSTCTVSPETYQAFTKP